MRKDLEKIVFQNKLLNRGGKPKDDTEAVIRFLLHQDVKLNASQDGLCNRVLYVDGLIRSRKYSKDQMIDLIVEKFGVNQFRANRDIDAAHKIFGETRKVSKAYLLSHHIEEIGMMIRKCQESGYHDLLPKLFDNYTYALNSLPDTEEAKEAPPAQITFVFNGAPPVEQQPVEDVIAEADNLLTNSNGEYIDFEDHTTESATDAGADGSGE